MRTDYEAVPPVGRPSAREPTTSFQPPFTEVNNTKTVCAIRKRYFMLPITTASGSIG